MTNNKHYGTISTIAKNDSKTKNLMAKIKILIGANKLRFSNHALIRMQQRKVIYYEVMQALKSGSHDSKRDRFSKKFSTWEYSVEGKTKDGRRLRIGVSFEITTKSGERLIVVTVIGLQKIGKL